MKALALVELAAVALALSSTVWVLGVQAAGLLRAMPRGRFLALQMSLVRVWARALAAIVAAVAALALVRAGARGALPAVVALVAASASAYGAVPRALRSGAQAIRGDEGQEMTAGGFLADGGGDVTRVWHRAVLACVAVVVVGLVLDVRAVIPPSVSEPAAAAATERTAQALPRARIDRVTAENIARLERDAAALLAAGGDGDPSAVSAAWNRIFAQCTTTGDDHARLHVFLAPLAPVVARVYGSAGDARRAAVRALVAALGRFDDGFTAEP